MVCLTLVPAMLLRNREEGMPLVTTACFLEVRTVRPRLTGDAVVKLDVDTPSNCPGTAILPDQNDRSAIPLSTPP